MSNEANKTCIKETPRFFKWGLVCVNRTTQRRQRRYGKEKKKEINATVLHNSKTRKKGS